MNLFRMDKMDILFCAIHNIGANASNAMKSVLAPDIRCETELEAAVSPP